MRPSRGEAEELVTIPMIKRKPTFAINSGEYRYGRLPETLYSEYLENKRVIIVGPAGYLQGQGQGKWIDSFDVVVRINHAIPIKFPADYGSKTSALYHILSHRGENGIHKKIVEKAEIEIWSKAGVEWLVSRHTATSQRIRLLQSILDGLVRWITIHRIFCRHLEQAIGSHPNTGMVAIMHLLNFPIKELQITGFDFYMSGVYDGYGDIKKGENPDTVNKMWHNNLDQINYLKRIKRIEKRLMFDEVLEKICEN